VGKEYIAIIEYNYESLDLIVVWNKCSMDKINRCFICEILAVQYYQNVSISIAVFQILELRPLVSIASNFVASLSRINYHKWERTVKFFK